jgi:hypothetical protein
MSSKKTPHTIKFKLSVLYLYVDRPFMDVQISAGTHFCTCKKRRKTAFQLTPNLTFAQFKFCNYLFVHACCQGKIQGSVWVRPDEHQTKYHGEVVRPHLVVRGAHALQVHAQQRQGVPLHLAQLACACSYIVRQRYRPSR